MEFERGLFRIYNRMLRERSLEVFCKAMGTFFLILGTLSLLFLITLHRSYVQENSLFRKPLSWVLFQEANVAIQFENETFTYEEVSIYAEDQFIFNFEGTSYNYSSRYEALRLPENSKNRMEFRTFNITIEERLPSFLGLIADMYSEMDTIVMNQVLYSFGESPGMLVNTNTSEIWFWRERDFAYFDTYSITSRLEKTFKAFVVYVLISCVTGLVCRIAIIGSASVWIFLASCSSLCRENGNMRLLYFSFIWIGHPAYSIERTNRSSAKVLAAFFLMLVVFYYLFYSSNFIWTALVFGNFFPARITNEFFVLITAIEFFSLIMVRTKKSIAVYPKLTAVIVLCFMIYRVNFMYPFMNIAFVVLYSYAIVLMTFCSIYIEKPVLLDEGPSIHSPRLMYQPVYSRTTPHFPEVWTLFYQVEPRGYFSSEEMSNILR